MKTVYIVVYHYCDVDDQPHTKYLGCFTSEEKAKEYCDAWNKDNAYKYGSEIYADFFKDESDKSYKDAE